MSDMNTMNPQLRDKLFKVLSQPERVEMAIWYQKDTWHCGTTACIAGWTLLLSGYKPYKDEFIGPKGALLDFMSIIPRAAKLLGLEQLVAFKLCLVSNWPKDLKKRYEAGDKATAAEALERALEGRL